MSNAAAKKVSTITTTQGTKLKAKAFKEVFGEKVVKTKVGWHRKSVGRWTDALTFEELLNGIEADLIDERTAANLSTTVWDARAARADTTGLTGVTAWSARRALEYKAHWGGCHNPSDPAPIHFPGGEGGILIAVSLRRDGSVKNFLSLEEWANVHFFSKPQGFQFLN